MKVDVYRTKRLSKRRSYSIALIEWRGCIFIYSCSIQVIYFEINLISKEISRAEPEYMNIHAPPPPLQLTL